MTNDTLITAWAAGLFEGEGTIGIIKGRVRVAIHMTDYDVLEKLRDNFGGQIYNTKKQKDHHKQSWVWTITSTENAMSFLMDIEPYLGSRRKARIDEAVNAVEDGKIVRSLRQRDQIEAFLKDGLTHEEMADRLGCSRSNVSHIIKRMRMVSIV